jgi:N-acetylglucosamine-6-phosphate deacetylase
MASLTPAQIVHADGQIGSLARGKFADMLIIDEQIRVHATYIGGRLVECT